MSRMLVVHGLRKSYQSGPALLEVLRDLSLEVETGTMIGVTGVSGSGKSTLLHLLGGMDRPDGGSISIAGRDILSLDRRELAKFRNGTVGFVFQFHYLLPEFTALENAAMPLLVRGESRAVAMEQARRVLVDVGLEDRCHHRPGELSGGEQQRVALARALAGRPRLLLADEPTGNLDPETGAAIGRLFRSLHASHDLTSMLVTHNERLASLCDHTYRLSGGKLIDPGGASG